METCFHSLKILALDYAESAALLHGRYKCKGKTHIIFLIGGWTGHRTVMNVWIGENCLNASEKNYSPSAYQPVLFFSQVTICGWSGGTFIDPMETCSCGNDEELLQSPDLKDVELVMYFLLRRSHSLKTLQEFHPLSIYQIKLWLLL